MAKNKHLGKADLYESHLLSLLSNQLHKQTDIEYLEAVREMSSSNVESAAFDIQALGELLANHISLEKGAEIRLSELQNEVQS